ncbi:protein YhfH [Bacillus carboniphilus]|uniref:Protein YhfH n=1 Tax=Bacillus carboniphilus TaxID=86663 RepID=A0ABY9JTX9_9BACI|nr:protein YhfH [Bacillus carboniphilus]WLR42861.1 protein YhfH [Bacillus carboniphilus]
MLVKMTEFLNKLPRKKCSSCGKEINEQHECYGNTCNECLCVK